MKKPIPPYMTFRQAMQAGYVGRIEDRKYMDWVKRLVCCGCGAPADDPHHITNTKNRAMGSKVPDYWVIPVCRTCHDAIHHDAAKWEDEHGTQYEHVCWTLLQAVACGRLDVG